MEEDETKNLNKILLLTLVILLIPVVPVQGAERSQDDLARLSSHIVVGRVESIESRWDGQGAFIYSYARILVERSLKEAVEDRWIVVKYMGGEVGDVGLWVSSEPRFKVGERIKLYLRQQKAGEFAVVHGRQGKISLDAEVGSAKWYSWTGHKWQSLPVPYYINFNVSSSYIPVIQASALTWENDDASYWDLTYVGTTTRVGGVKDGYNVISWEYIDGSGGILAQATTWYNILTKAIFETDMKFDSADSWSISGEPDKFDVQNIATHEFGHWIMLLDLYDSADSEETMYGYASPGETKKRTLYVGDMAGVRIVYPYPSAPRTSMAIDKTSYAPGETAIIGLVLTNPTSTTYSGARLVIEAVLPTGSKITLFNSGKFKLEPKFGDTRFGSAAIPSVAPRGTYELEDTLTYGGNTYTYTLLFTIS